MSMIIGQGLVHASRMTALSNYLNRPSIHRYCYFSIGSASNQHLEDNNNIKSKASNLYIGTKVPYRNLFGDHALGIYKLESLQTTKKQFYASGKERYIERLANYLKSENTKSILKDDLANMIALAENEWHLDITEKIIMSKKQDSLISGWGASLMRLYYKMNQVDRAYNNIKDNETFGSFFNQNSTYQIVMTMLFKAGRYQDVIEVYKMSKDRLNHQGAENQFPTYRRLTLLVFAAYAKINTPEAFKAAQELYFSDTRNPFFKKRVLSLLSYLAINQDKPTIALDIISEETRKNYTSHTMLRIISLIKLKRYEDILYQLRESIKELKPGFFVINKEVYELIESKQEEIEDQSVRHELMDILGEIKNNRLMSEETLDSLIFKPVERDSAGRGLKRAE